MAQAGVTDGTTNHVARIADYLRDAFVELEVWRQNARSVEERQALHRITSLLSQAAADLRHEYGGDPMQQTLPLPGGGSTRGPRGRSRT